MEIFKNLDFKNLHVRWVENHLRAPLLQTPEEFQN